MPIHVIKESIELDEVTLDSEGNAFIQKRVNLQGGYVHNLLQTDIFQDAMFTSPSGTEATPPIMEIVISPYPQIPTEMNLSTTPPVYGNRYASAGDDSVLFKANAEIRSFVFVDFNQFPSKQIASMQKQQFYSNHVYLSVHISGVAEETYQTLALSFLMVFEDKNTSYVTSTMGQIHENHVAMCSELMSNGRIISKASLQGNVFPMWRYGGIRPELTVSPTAPGSFFLKLTSRDEESMQTTTEIRTALADSRSMSAFDEAFGNLYPDWFREVANEGIVSGPVREQWPPIKHADNGNVLML